MSPLQIVGLGVMNATLAVMTRLLAPRLFMTTDWTEAAYHIDVQITVTPMHQTVYGTLGMLELNVIIA